MKKKLIVGLGVAGLLLSACGSSGDKVVCTGSQEQNGQKGEAKIIATLKDGKVDKIDTEVTYSNEDTVKQMCGLLEFANAFAESEDDKVDYKCEGKTIYIYDVDDTNDEGVKIKGMTKDEFIEYAKSSSEDVTCK